MLFEEFPKVKGEVRIKKWNSQGKLTASRIIPNLVVASGKDFIASRMVGVSSNIMSHIAVGTDATAAAVGNTGLNTEVGRVALFSSTVSGNVVTYTATFPAGTGTGNLTEAGIFNASSGGTMLCRTTFATVEKEAGDVISITWTITVL